MLVKDAMSPLVVEVGTGHTLLQAARLMSDRNVGAAIVSDPDGFGPGILTERDVLRAVAAGEDPGVALVAAHVTTSVVYAAPDWSLDEAATAMVAGGFRHLVVMRGADVGGVISVRDIARAWAQERGLVAEATEARRTPEASDAEAVMGTA